MISKEFAQFFVDKHACDERFVKMARVTGYPESNDPQDFVSALVKLQEECGVAGLKMSDYGFKKEECMTLAKAARDLQGGLYDANPCEATDEDIAGIFERSYQ
jgi:alcohol dehydrogenase